MDINSINIKLNQKGDQAEQFWQNREEVKNFSFDTSFFNSLLGVKTNRKIEKDSKDDGFYSFISGLFNMFTDKKP